MNWSGKILKKMSKINHFPYLTKNSAELEYFLEYTGSNGYLLILNRDRFYFFTDARYFELYKQKFPDQIQLISAGQKIYEQINSLLEKEELKETLYINPRFFSYQEVLEIRKKIKPFKFKPHPDDISLIRSFKEKEDIESLKKTIALTEEGIAYFMASLKAGISEKEAAADLEYYVKKKGAALSFPIIVLFGENSAYPHGEPGERKLKKGDVVLIDFGLKQNHLCSDMTRTFCFEEMPEGFSDDYNLLLSLQMEIIRSIKPDMKASVLDLDFRKKLKKIGKEQYYLHSLGHGIGTEVHEPPALSYLKKKEILSRNKLFTIEPGFYMEGRYGIRIEDMVYIDSRGKVVVLTTFPKTLLIKR